MKIKDMKITIPSEKIMKTYIDKLMAGEDLSDHDVNRIMKYLGFDDEETICVWVRCHECPYYIDKTGISCTTSFNEHVRHLIAMKNRCNLEDIL